LNEVLNTYDEWPAAIGNKIAGRRQA
jgi:hypothetical protein